MNSKLTGISFAIANLSIVATTFVTRSLKKKSLSKLIIALLTVAVCSFLTANGILIYSAAQYASEIPALYSCVFTGTHVVLTVIFYVKVIQERCQLFVNQHKSKIILQGLESAHTQHPSRRKVVFLLKSSLVLLSLGHALLNVFIYDYGFLVKVFKAELSLKAMVLATTRTLCEPLNVFHSVIVYNFIFCNLFELEALDCVFGSLFQIHNTAWSSLGIFCISNTTFDLSEIVSNDKQIFKKVDPKSKIGSRSVAKRCFWKKLFEVFNEIENVSIESTNFWIDKFLFQTLLLVVAFPVTLVYYDATGELHLESLLALICSNVLSLSSVMLHTFTMYKCNYSISKMKREIFDYDDISARNVLKRFILLAKDPFTQSHNGLTDADFELVSKMIDFVVLISTSLFVA